MIKGPLNSKIEVPPRLKEDSQHDHKSGCMKIKVGDKIYDGEKEPVMIILTEQDKINIRDMHPDCTKYCVYPNGEEEWIEDDYKKIKEWMAKI